MNTLYLVGERTLPCEFIAITVCSDQLSFLTLAAWEMNSEHTLPSEFSSNLLRASANSASYF